MQTHEEMDGRRDYPNHVIQITKCRDLWNHNNIPQCHDFACNVVRRSRVLTSVILHVYSGYSTSNIYHFFFRFTHSVIRHYITQFNNTGQLKIHNDTAYWRMNCARVYGSPSRTATTMECSASLLQRPPVLNVKCSIYLAQCFYVSDWPHSNPRSVHSYIFY
jgi:hypothetical protein